MCSYERVAMGTAPIASQPSRLQNRLGLISKTRRKLVGEQLWCLQGRHMLKEERLIDCMATHVIAVGCHLSRLAIRRQFPLHNSLVSPSIINILRVFYYKIIDVSIVQRRATPMPSSHDFWAY